MQLVTVEEVEAARAVLTGIVRPAPVGRSDTLTRIVGRPVVLAHEELQRTGSFKIRGAYHHLSRYVARATPEQLAAGVVAASAGNHAQGVALASQLLGVGSTIFMPSTAALPKVEATRGYGAEVVLGGATVEDAMHAAHAHASRTGAHFVAPFDDSDVIAGQGTLGLELAEQAPDVGVFVVPVGGGGLISGVAVALKARRPDCRIVGVEAQGAASMTAALAAGHPVELDHLDTMADGIAIRRVSGRTLAHVQALVDEVVTVGDEEISQALLLLAERTKVVVEPAGATPLAALLAGKVTGQGTAGLVLSGGNVDPTLLMQVIRHGLVTSGRYLTVRCTIEDRPGQLHGLLGFIASRGLNVIDVEHHRTGPGLAVDEVDVVLTLETRDPAHSAEVLDQLRAQGYRAGTA